MNEFSILFNKEAYFYSDQPLGYFQMQLSIEFLNKLVFILNQKKIESEYELISTATQNH